MNGYDEVRPVPVATLGASRDHLPGRITRRPVRDASRRRVGSPPRRPTYDRSVFIPDRRLALAYRVIAAGLVFWGIARITGLFTGHVAGVQFLYFTVLSNILCLGWFVALAARTVRDLVRDGTRGQSTPSARFGGAVMMAITVTMLIYLIILVPEAFTQRSGYTPFTLTDNLIHIFTPLLTIGDWLLFTAKGAFRWYDPPLWAIVPAAYLVFAFAYGGLGGTFGGGTPYPYPFMEVDRLGIGGVAVWLVGLGVALEIVAFVYVALDRGLGVVARRFARRSGAPVAAP